MIKVQEAKQLGVLYHYTSVNSVMAILKSNTLRPPLSNLNYTSISFTRDKNFHRVSRMLGDVIQARIVVDGNKLSEKYKVEPYNFFYDSRIKLPAMYSKSSESEERIVGKKIDHVRDYILRVDFLEILPLISFARYSPSIRAHFQSISKPGEEMPSDFLVTFIKDTYNIPCEVLNDPYRANERYEDDQD